MSDSDTSSAEARREKRKKERKREKKERKKAKKAKLYEVAGYTNDNNPFGDSDLGRKFVWKKKPPSTRQRTDEESLEEIEKVRRRRQLREREVAEREEQRSEEFRRKEAESFEEVAKNLDKFHKEQIRTRCKLRVLEHRARAVDVLAQNLLLLADDDAARRRRAAEDHLPVDDDESAEKKTLPLQTRAPSAILGAASAAELTEALEGARDFLAIGDSASYWREVAVACEVRLLPKPRVHADAVELVEQSFHGSVEDIERQLRDDVQRRPDDGPRDVEYWNFVEGVGRRALADARLDAMHRDLLSRCRDVTTEEPKPTKKKDQPPPFSAQSNKPTSATAPVETAAEAMVRRERERGMESDEELFATEVPTTEAPTTALSEPRKPRYLNKIKTGFEWNKYNQTHYSTDEPPPRTVQGYKFNIFYPDLLDPSKPPSYVLQKTETQDHVVIRFKAGPPYEDLAFRIVNQEWDVAPRKGFRCVFERGILQLHFNFKKWRYRR